MVLKSFRLFSAMLLFAAALLGPVRADANVDPSALVDRLNGTLINVMQKSDELGYNGRYETLAPILVDSFNFPAMARISVGKHWNSLSQEQKKELSQIFARLSVATFAARFDGYGGEQFRITGKRDQKRNTVLVENELVKTSGDSIPINYLVREFDGDWRIIDVYLDAKYSELALKRSEYSAVLQREGFDGLVNTMQAKIDQYAAGK